MPKNTVTDLITDQEMAFARLVLSGTMTDRDAAQAAGLPPATAAYTKSRPRVRAYMAEHRAAVEQLLVQQEAEQRRQRNLTRERVLTRLWEVAGMSADMTRNSMTSQVKALALIVAIEGLVPDRRTGSTDKQTTSPLAHPGFYKAEWLRRQQGEAIDPEPGPASPQQAEAPVAAQPEPPPLPAANPASPRPTTSWVPDALSDTAPDTRVPFSIKKNPFARRH